MSRDIRVVYAPVHGAQLNVTESEHFTTGKLEEDCKVEIAPQYAGFAHDLRLLDCHVKISLYDMEAVKDDISFRNRAIYEAYQNTRLHSFNLLCGSGALTEYGFRYNFYPDYLPKRGMRWVHQLTGVSKNLEWITFLDEGWAAFYDSLLLTSIDVDSDTPNLFLL